MPLSLNPSHPSHAGVTLSFSKAEYTVSESDSAVVVQLTKNKPLANHLEVVVTALTLEEADFLGCLPLNTSLKQAGVCSLFTLENNGLLPRPTKFSMHSLINQLYNLL